MTASEGTCSGKVPSPMNSVGRRDRLGDPVVGGAREPQTGLRVGPFETLMHQARAQHLDVDPHRIHLRKTLGEVAHPAEHQAGALLDLAAHLVGDTGIARQLGKDVVLRGDGIDLGHDDVGMDIDGGRAGERSERPARRLYGARAYRVGRRA